MHNLHLIVTRGKDAEDACYSAEIGIEEWGNENNWRTICGCVSEDNEVFITGDGRFPPTDDSNTIEKINKMVKSWIGGEGTMVSHVIPQTLDKLKNGEKLTSHEWWQVKEHASHMYDAVNFDDKEFNVIEDNFRYGEYDENAVSNWLENHYEDEGKIYVVFLDMHS